MLIFTFENKEKWYWFFFKGFVEFSYNFILPLHLILFNVRILLLIIGTFIQLISVAGMPDTFNTVTNLNTLWYMLQVITSA